MSASSSPASKSPLARRIEFVIRDMQDRIRRLEHRKVVQVGSWRIEEGPEGLVAYHPGKDVRVVLAALEGGGE